MNLMDESLQNSSAPTPPTWSPEKDDKEASNELLSLGARVQEIKSELAAVRQVTSILKNRPLTQPAQCTPARNDQLKNIELNNISSSERPKPTHRRQSVDSFEVKII